MADQKNVIEDRNKLYVEVRKTVQRTGRPVLVPLTEIAKHTGFRTIVAYDEDTAALIRDQGGTQNLRGISVYADTLFLDFDGHDPSEFRVWLQASGLAYEEFDSGGRSIHFHIPIEPVFSAWVTGAMRVWVKKHAPTADVSFYHPAGLYRLPGTYHWKNAGRRKQLIDSRSGSLLNLEQEKTTSRLILEPTGSSEELYILLLERKGEGHRTPFLWKLATVAAESGMPFEEALKVVRWWNEHNSVPSHPDHLVIKQCESAYKRLEGRKYG